MKLTYDIFDEARKVAETTDPGEMVREERNIVTAYQRARKSDKSFVCTRLELADLLQVCCVRPFTGTHASLDAVMLKTIFDNAHLFNMLD